MHPRLTPVLLVLLALHASSYPAAAQRTTYGVTVLDREADDLKKAATYSWAAGRQAPDKEVDRQIVAAVDRELGARGLVKQTSGPGDLQVSYSALRRTDVDVDAKPSASGERPEYTVGTLLLDIRDASNRTSLFRVRMNTPIDLDPVKLAAVIDTAVEEIFEAYPVDKPKR